LEFSTRTSAPEKAKAGCIAVGVFEGHKLTREAEAVDRAARGMLRELVKRGDMEGKLGATRVLFRVPGIASGRVVLFGLGKEEDLGAKQFREAVQAATRAIADTGAGEALLYAVELAVAERDHAWKARHAVMAAADVVGTARCLFCTRNIIREGLSYVIAC
jgi:leucyl aminopeptidase